MDNPCETCKWWDNEHARLKYAPEISGISQPGFCRKHKPGAYTAKNASGEVFAIGIQPIMDAKETCAEHKGKT